MSATKPRKVFTTWVEMPPSGFQIQRVFLGSLAGWAIPSGLALRRGSRLSSLATAGLAMYTTLSPEWRMLDFVWYSSASNYCALRRVWNRQHAFQLEPFG